MKSVNKNSNSRFQSLTSFNFWIRVVHYLLQILLVPLIAANARLRFSVFIDYFLTTMVALAKSIPLCPTIFDRKNDPT